MKKLLTTIALATMSFTAVAGELIVHGLSMHANDGYTKNGEFKRYNETNYGLGYRSDDGWVVGAYYNSYYKPSIYAGYNWMWSVGPTMFGRQPEIGLMLVGVTGYQHRSNMMVTPMAGFNLKVPAGDRTSILFTVSPVPYERADGSQFLGHVSSVSMMYRF